jgi:hypothetical protein
MPTDAGSQRGPCYLGDFLTRRLTTDFLEGACRPRGWREPTPGGRSPAEGGWPAHRPCVTPADDRAAGGPFQLDDDGGDRHVLTHLRDSVAGARPAVVSTRQPKKVPRRVTGYATLFRRAWPARLRRRRAWRVLTSTWSAAAHASQVHSSSFWTFWESGCYVIGPAARAPGPALRRSVARVLS